MSDQKKWVKDYPDALVDFSTRYDKEISGGKKDPTLLAIFATGGGMSLSNLAEVPGASRRLALTHHPYSQKDTIRFLNHNGIIADEITWDYCSAASSVLYREALISMCDHQPYLYVAVTAALTTTRWRRGKNRAYVAISRLANKPEIWEISLAKNSEAGYEALFKNDDDSIDLESLTLQRRSEDQKISRAVLAIILEDRTFANLNDGESISTVEVLSNGKTSVSKSLWLEGEG